MHNFGENAAGRLCGSTVAAIRVVVHFRFNDDDDDDAAIGGVRVFLGDR